MFGRIVYSAPYTEKIVLPEISDGIYILGIASEKLPE